MKMSHPSGNAATNSSGGGGGSGSGSGSALYARRSLRVIDPESDVSIDFPPDYIIISSVVGYITYLPCNS